MATQPVLRPGRGQWCDRRRVQSVKEDLYNRVIPQLKPDIIATMNFGYEVPGQFVGYLGSDRAVHDTGSPELSAWLDKTTIDSLAELRAGVRKVVLIEPTPYEPHFDPLACLSQARVVEQCRYVAAAGPSGLEQLYRRLDKQDDHVWSLDLDHVVCPYFPICDPIVNHQVTKIDGPATSPVPSLRRSHPTSTRTSRRMGSSRADAIRRPAPRATSMSHRAGGDSCTVAPFARDPGFGAIWP